MCTGLKDDDRLVSHIATDDFGVYEVHVYLWEEPAAVTVSGAAAVSLAQQPAV